ncbi:hypothetical protein BOTCAL_0018g00260 [Botryotinia calthae]|uniref:Uncharacterized protein n=1 Tax=Botryotinia calthae TaxID=38488 RepID=A0A4Y8DF82_9HELO|nr:hypothetical protein BOTCAL_0018g00260 [Botryotinia calthae]
MDQAIVIDDDDGVAVVMIEDDDRDEVVILERAPSMSSTHFFINPNIGNRPSRLKPSEYYLTESMLRSQSASFPLIDLTAAMPSSSTKSQESNSPRERLCGVSATPPGFILQDEGYESLRPGDITVEAITNQETS